MSLQQFFDKRVIVACLSGGSTQTEVISELLDVDTILSSEADRWPGLVFVAADGGFFCRTCVGYPCDEMIQATLADEPVAIEQRQWRIVGAQDPELGHGDTCSHCMAWTIPAPTNADWYVDPWPLLDKFARSSPNLDPRAYGGDRNGPTDCAGLELPGIPEKYPGGKPRGVPIDTRTTSLFINVVGKIVVIAPDVDDVDDYTPSSADCEGVP